MSIHLQANAGEPKQKPPNRVVFCFAFLLVQSGEIVQRTETELCSVTGNVCRFCLRNAEL
jgi:hypothetical protein